MKEIVGIYHHMEQLSPEVLMAQRMEELRQLAMYRRLRLQKYIDWSDPIKHAEMMKQYEQEEAVAKEKLKDIPADIISVREYGSTWLQMKSKYMHQPQPFQLTLKEKIKKWMKGKLSKLSVFCSL